MSEDFAAALETYRVQLSQIDSALLATDCPNVEEMLKLKKDLEEVIALTQALEEQSKEPVPRGVSKFVETTAKPRRSAWKAGDTCMAFLSKENSYKVGFIKEIVDDKSCCVTFPGNWKEIVQLDSLKKTKVNLKAERKKVKKEKYEEKTKQMNQVAEDKKKTWQSFLGKKSSKFATKKSIFATPDTANGRVGVGTCGVSGQPMTQFSSVKKLTKGPKSELSQFPSK